MSRILPLTLTALSLFAAACSESRCPKRYVQRGSVCKVCPTGSAPSDNECVTIDGGVVVDPLETDGGQEARDGAQPSGDGGTAPDSVGAHDAAGEDAGPSSSTKDANTDLPDVDEPNRQDASDKDAVVAFGACIGDTWDHDGDPATSCAPRTRCHAGERVTYDGDPASNRVCTNCGSGTFTTGENARNCTDWTRCDAGTYVSNTPSDREDRTCELCGAGMLTELPNQSSCLPPGSCQAGRRQTMPATSSSPPVCTACSPGEYCAGGTAMPMACTGSDWDEDANPATVCTARTTCSLGTHITMEGGAKTDRTCERCADGTFSMQINAPSCSVWTSCATGFQEDTPGSSSTNRVCVLSAWTAQFGTSLGDRGTGVSLDGNGNLYVSGQTNGAFTASGQSSAGAEDAFVRKIDSAGAELWTRQFGSSLADNGGAVRADATGNVYVSGFTEGTLAGQSSAGSHDAFLRKYAADGTHIWTRQFGTDVLDVANSVGFDGAGNVYVAGRTQGAFAGQSNRGADDAFVRKFDGDGNVLWTRQFGTTVADFPTSLSVDVNGRTYVAGYTAGVFSGLAGVGGVDGFVHRLDNAGADISTWQFGTTAGDFCYAVQVDPAGNVYVAGETSGAFPGETALGLGDAFLRKYEKSGAVAWTRLFATTYGDTSYALALDNAGSAYITGLISGTANGQGGAGYDDTYVRKYDGQGAVVWSRQLGTDRVDYGFGLVVGKGGNAFLVGDTDGALMGKTNNGSRDVIVLKLAP